MVDRARLLVAGDAVAPTGFARVTASICRRLSDRFEIHQLGVNYTGDPHDLPWPIYPAHLGGSCPYGVHRIRELVRCLRPDVVLLVNDRWTISRYMQELAPLKEPVPVVAYVPIDACPIDPEEVVGLSSLDLLVVYNEFGRNTMTDAVDLATKEGLISQFPEIDVVPHGVDTEIFYPLEPQVHEAILVDGRKAAKRRVFSDQPGLWDDSWIVLNANRNQPRKRIDTTMRGFALFAADKPESVKLYLHMGMEDRGWDVLRYAKRLGIVGHLAVTSVERSMPNVSVSRLNSIYNACEVGINTAVGEAWGLTSFEHAATRAAQIVPGHSGPAELWIGHADLLETRFETIEPKVLTEECFVSPDDVAEVLQQLYDDPNRLDDMSELAFRRANAQDLQWDVIADQWQTILSDVTGPRN